MSLLQEPAVAIRDATPHASEAAERRILDATRDLIARWGVAKTTLPDVAKRSGLSRATIYRAFPGGKDHLFAALARRELDGLVDAVTEAIDEADTLEDALTMAIVVASRVVADHGAAQFVLAHEPEVLLPVVGFRNLNAVFPFVHRTVEPHLHRFLDPDDAGWAAEWSARLFLSYLLSPDRDRTLTDPIRTRALVAGFVTPAFAHHHQSKEHP